jgi:hypothetical protein
VVVSSSGSHRVEDQSGDPSQFDRNRLSGSGRLGDSEPLRVAFETSEHIVGLAALQRVRDRRRDT